MKNVLFLLALGVAVLAGSWVVYPGEKAVQRIVIDVGHGGQDPGAVVNGVMEKEIVLAIARKVEELNDDESVEIIILRQSDEARSLKERLELISNSNPDRAISLHANKHVKPSEHGAEVYIFPENEFLEESRQFAERMLKAVGSGNLASRSVKAANFYLLKHSQCPMICLEIGFLSNPKDRVFLSSEEGQEQIARNILTGLKTN